MWPGDLDCQSQHQLHFLGSHNLRPERVPEDNRQQAAGNEAVARTQQSLFNVVVKDERHHNIGQEDVKEHCADKHVEASHSIGAAESS